MDRLTRKELKQDRFAMEVQHGVEYFGMHRQMVLRWAAVVIGVVILIVALLMYRNHERSVRQEALYKALQIEGAEVEPSTNEYTVSFATSAERYKAIDKAFTDLANKYSGSDEGLIAEYYLGTTAADQGNIPQAEVHLKKVVDSDSTYTPLAKLALAQIYAGEGKLRDGEKLIQSIIDHPTALVSKEEATIVLAELIAPTDPARARKMLEVLRNHPRPNVSRAAINALSDISSK